MFHVIAALQPLFVGAVLLWSARVKLFDRRAVDMAGRSALVPLVGERRAVPVYRLTGVAELVLGALLVLPPALPLESAAAGALAVGFLGYLGYAHRTAPDSSCGCMGAKHTPVSWRSFTRAGGLVLASLFATFAAEGYWWGAVADQPAVAGAVLLAEVAALVALSGEFDDAWLIPLRQLRMRLTHPLTGGYGVPLLASVQQLQLSGAYRRVGAMLTSDVREHWVDEEWRMVVYTARYQGRPATAVFAVPLEHDPGRVKVALVDDATSATLFAVDSVDIAPPTEPQLDPGPGHPVNPAFAG